MRASWILITSLFCSTSLLITSANAWPDGRSKTESVYKSDLAIKTANGAIAHALIDIRVTAWLTVNENGNARFPDDRSCEFKDVNRMMTRSLSITMPSGTVIPVADTTIKLPAADGKSWSKVTPCNDVAGQSEGFLSSAIGSADKWQTYIDGERADAQKIIDQFGQVI